jgi:hypothetical protein
MATVTKNADGTFTMTFAPRETRAIDRLVIEKSIALPGLTDAALLTQRVTSYVQEAIARFRDRDAAERQVRYDRAPNNVQQQIDDALASYAQ